MVLLRDSFSLFLAAQRHSASNSSETSTHARDVVNSLRSTCYICEYACFGFFIYFAVMVHRYRIYEIQKKLAITTINCVLYRSMYLYLAMPSNDSSDSLNLSIAGDSCLLLVQLISHHWFHVYMPCYGTYISHRYIIYLTTYLLVFIYLSTAAITVPIYHFISIFSTILSPLSIQFYGLSLMCYINYCSCSNYMIFHIRIYIYHIIINISFVTSNPQYNCQLGCARFACAMGKSRNLSPNVDECNISNSCHCSIIM